MSSKKKYLLVVEDDRGLQKQLRWAFEDFEVVISADREDAISQLRRVQPGVVLLDLGLPPDPGGVTEGLATLQEILALTPETKIIVVTGDNDRANAVKAIALGAYDFYQKPVDAEMLGLIVERAYRVYELEIENRRLTQHKDQMPLAGVIATSPQMLEVCRVIEKIAPTDVTTLLLGASGTGKERFAQALHALSHRSDRRMVVINCAAIPDALLESELFGYEKGAFTGAHKTTPGKIEYAEGGSLFLDEIGDLPIELQAKLLRFLQERVVERVGGRAVIPVDVRIICATHQNLEALIQEGRFREDLYYRISEITVNIPPLKDREGDALVLANAFLHRFMAEMKSKVKGFTPEAVQAIESYEWPGNVRELESRVKRSSIMADSAYITPHDLQLEESASEPTPLNLKEVREDAERKAILRAMDHCNDNISDTANVLGITRPTLYNLLEKLGLKNPG